MVDTMMMLLVSDFPSCKLAFVAFLYSLLFAVLVLALGPVFSSSRSSWLSVGPVSIRSSFLVAPYVQLWQMSDWPSICSPTRTLMMPFLMPSSVPWRGH